MTNGTLAERPEARRPWIRTVYLYLLAMLGLVLLTIGGIRLLDMGLKAFVFTQAEQEERFMYQQPPMPVALERVERIGRGEEAELTPEERALVRQWVEDYRSWKERSERVDVIVARRQRTASSSLAMILVGLPLYLYHWGVIRKEK